MGREFTAIGLIVGFVLLIIALPEEYSILKLLSVLIVSLIGLNMISD